MDYFNNITRTDLNDFIKDVDKVYAHVTKDQRLETLEEHSNLCICYLLKIIEKKQLVNVFISLEERLLRNISKEGKQFYRVLLYHTIYFHDVGKINCNFQYLKMKNKYYKNKYNIDCNTSNHSMLSALIYINEFLTKLNVINDEEERQLLCTLLLFNAYVISKHHGDFDSFEEFKRKLIEPDGEGKRLYTEQSTLYRSNYVTCIFGKKPNERINKLLKMVDKKLDKLCTLNNEISIDLYIYERFLSSLLLASDFYATSDFKNQTKIDDFGEIKDVDDFYKLFKESPTYCKIRSYEKKEYYKTDKAYEYIKDINVLRNELFLDAEKTLIRNINKNIFYLEAPTGAGKSKVSLNLAFKMVEQSACTNKIFYVYPFNTLIEQNIESLYKIFGSSEQMRHIAVINSLVPIKRSNKIRNDNEDGDVINETKTDYIRSLLDRQFLHYPIILTTHVSMFRFLFGTNKEDLFPLSQIANSVIIFDEIQSYKNSIWKDIITFLNHYSQLLNIKVIIMSATLPNLSKLVGNKIEAVNLIENKSKYFMNPMFKDRVQLDFSLIQETENILDKLLVHVKRSAEKENINILMEFIYRSSADEAYVRLCEMEGIKKEILLLTGESSSYERKRIVKNFKENKDIILVSTQVIEAGVDLDANIGYKDISLLDSEEQFIGRVNRNFTNEKEVGKVYFFNLDSAAELYRGDVRKELMHTLINEEIRKIIINKDFELYYERIIDFLLNRINSADGFNDFMDNSVNNLNFREVEKRLNLIDEQYQYSIFMSRDLYISDTQMLNGDEVWDNYASLLENKKMDYSERRIKLQEASINLNYFIYKTRKNDFSYEKHIGDLYYLSDVDKYFENGRFIRKNFDGDLFM